MALALSTVSMENVPPDEEMTRLKEELHQAQKMDAVGLLAGGVAHEMNNVFHAILGMNDLLQRKADREDPDFELYDELAEAARDGVRLTRQLLSFSQKRRFAAETLELTSVVEEGLAQIRQEMGDPFCVEVAPCSEDLLISGDRDAIVEILKQLCMNAWEAMEGEERSDRVVRITLGSLNGEEDVSMYHALYGEGRHAFFRVEDRGIGMSQEFQSRIMDPFFTTKSTTSGRGLGLSTAYGLTRQHGGLLDIESEVGQGSRFTVYFPLDQPRVAELKGGHQGTLLLAEDDRRLRRILKRVLARAGYRILTAEDGEDAVECIQRMGAGIDLVLTDVVMPGVDGWEVVRTFRACSPKGPAVVISGVSIEMMRQNAPPVAGVYMMSKPIELEQLLKTLQKALSAA